MAHPYPHPRTEPRPHHRSTPRRSPRNRPAAAALAGACLATLSLPALTAPTASAAQSAPTPQSAPAARSAPAPLNVRLDPSYQQPAFQGWGTALAWFANVTGGWPDSQRDKLADALYSADGLGFTIARYNIGGGDSPETAPYMRPGAAVPGHWNRPGPQSPDWWNPDDPTHWNPDADANQRWWLTAAKARGAATFEAFSNSAPYFMTESGLTSGATNAWQNNLRPDQYGKFAAYLAGSVQRVQQSTGVTFDSLSPVNEPHTDYWRAGGRQEGSHWDPDAQARMVATLRSALDAKGSRLPIAAMDETNPQLFRTNWETYAPAVRSSVGRLNTHTYGTNGRTGARDIAKGESIPLWMSEVDVGGSVPQSFTDMSPAFDLTRRINDDIRELEPRAWVLWQAVEDYENMTPAHENSNWGLIQTDFTPADAATEPLRKNKKYWAMANYSRFVRPGARVINTDDPNTLAALSPDGLGTVVVHTNPTGEEQDLTLDLAGFGTVGAGPVQRHTTDATKDLRREGDVTTTGKSLKATVGAGSVTTFVLPGTAGVDPSATTAPLGGPRQLVNDHSGLALAVDAALAPVQRAADPADPAQQWTLSKLDTTDWGSTAAYRITHSTSGKALSVSGDTLTLATTGDSTGQQWIRSTGGDGRTTLVNRATGKLLDVTGESTTDGDPVGVYRPTTGANQSWTFRSTARPGGRRTS
ncbi:glycoside hydrolase [Streptomyces sp. NPDC051561]|uniref:glycoside hydrolase n=1 Tax=Streptomyces sp. NPDC051561 TaxID=3365658 RepID=UPI0037BBD129